jgi:hypothetical protein
MEKSKQRATAAERAKRYRDKKRQGQTTRQQRNADEQLALLQQPYTELSEKEKTLVRYYRKQARKKAHQVAALFPTPLGTSPPAQLPLVSHSVSSFDSSSNMNSPSKQRTAETLFSLSQQQQPLIVETTSSAAILKLVAPLSSSQSVATSATTMSMQNDDSTEILSTTTSTTSMSPLVHPYEEALARSRQADMISSADTVPSRTVPTQQWKRFHDQLNQRVLLPSSRNNHMTHVITSAEHDEKSSSNNSTTLTGRYLQVFDVHTSHDSATPDTNIIQQLHSNNISSTSPPSSTSQLRQMLSFNASYPQEAYCQFSVTGPSPQPVVESSVLSRSDAYQRLIKASESARSSTDMPRDPQQQNVFLPTINIDSIKNDPLKQRLKTVVTAVQHQYKSHTPHKHLEIECDHVFATPLDGFGIDGVQLYLKSGECVTWLHDELLWCSAINYMLRESIGCALWIAIGLHDLKQVMSVSEMDAIFRRPQSKKDIMTIGALLDKLIGKKIYMEYALQKPGQGISSPPGIGAAHLVFADGILMSQLAWNYSFTMPGAIDCLAFWGGHEHTHGHLSLSNGSMATRSVLPLYSMQVNGYDFNLADKVKTYYDFVSRLKQTYPQRRYRVKINPDTRHPHCRKCLFRQDWICINNQCIHCCYNKHNKI